MLSAFKRLMLWPAGKRGDVQATVRQLKAELAKEAAQLSQRRRAAAGSLRAAVESCLADLSMAGSRFDVRIGWEEHAKVSARLDCYLAADVGNEGTVRL